MQQTISQRRAILEGLRQRCSLSTAEFYDKVDRFNPAPLYRFSVIPNGNNQFSVVERASGKVRQVCTGHNPACELAEQLEKEPASKPASFATLMLQWTLAFCAILLLFAVYGALK